MPFPILSQMWPNTRLWGKSPHLRNYCTIYTCSKDRIWIGGFHICTPPTHTHTVAGQVAGAPSLGAPPSCVSLTAGHLITADNVLSVYQMLNFNNDSHSDL